MNTLISHSPRRLRMAKIAALLCLWMVVADTWGEEPIKYYKVTKLTTGEIYQGALIANESTNLDKEIVIFDYESKRKIGPFRSQDGYSWSLLNYNPDEGVLIVFNDEETKRLNTSNPTFWVISTNTIAYVSENKKAATVVSDIDLKDTNVLNLIWHSFGVMIHTNVGMVTLKYSFDDSGGGTKSLSIWSALNNSEHVLGSVAVGRVAKNAALNDLLNVTSLQ